MSTKLKVYQCRECGLHYHNKKVVKRCAAFCKKYSGCSLEITKLSIERSKTSD